MLLANGSNVPHFNYKDCLSEYNYIYISDKCKLYYPKFNNNPLILRGYRVTKLYEGPYY